jgi:sugar phosphate isomerase/epimerase
MQPVNAYAASFLNTLAQAGRFCEEIKYHPAIRIAPHLFHMVIAEADVYSALATHAELIRYISISDSNQRLPGSGLLDWAKIAQSVAHYRGWWTISPQAYPELMTELPLTLARLREQGLR